MAPIELDSSQILQNLVHFQKNKTVRKDTFWKTFRVLENYFRSDRCAECGGRFAPRALRKISHLERVGIVETRDGAIRVPAPLRSTVGRAIIAAMRIAAQS